MMEETEGARDVLGWPWRPADGAGAVRCRRSIHDFQTPSLPTRNLLDSQNRL